MHRSNVELQVTLCMFPSYDFMSPILRTLSRDHHAPVFPPYQNKDPRKQWDRNTSESSMGFLKRGTVQYQESKSARGFVENVTPRDEEFRSDRNCIGMSRLACPSCWNCAKDAAEQTFLFLYFQRVFWGSACSPNNILLQSN